jgi:ABC-type oligopeptide transport system substrate-binding subunit
MKQLLFVIICFLSFSVSSLAQTSETFDIATFQTPKSWHKQASQNSLQISTEDKANGTYCLITLFKSLPGTNNSRENFDAAWQMVVKGLVNVSTAPQMSVLPC